MNIMRDRSFHKLRTGLPQRDGTGFGDERGDVFVREGYCGSDGGVACERDLGKGQEDIDVAG